MADQTLLLSCSPSLPYVCETCGARCSTGAHAPSSILGDVGAYHVEPGVWQCQTCSRKTWAAYLRLRRERLALILYSREVGYPARLSEMQARTPDQLELLP